MQILSEGQTLGSERFANDAAHARDADFQRFHDAAYCFLFAAKGILIDTLFQPSTFRNAGALPKSLTL